VRRISLALIELESGRGTTAHVEEAARELHTVKGESRMLDLQPVAELAHAAEDLILGCQGLPPAELCAQVIGGLDVLARALVSDPRSEESVSALREAAEILRASAPSAPVAVAEPVAEPDPEPEPAEKAKTEKDERWIQVNARQVDQVCEQVAQVSADFRALNSRLLASDGASPAARRALLEDFDRCRTLVDGLFSSSWSLRLQQIEPALGDLVRHARELAVSQGKRVRAQVQAAGAQIERTVLDELWEPLVHIVRNAVDHGIEPPDARNGKPAEAQLQLRAEAAGAGVLLTISDDGRGIDPEVVRAAAVHKGLLSDEAARALGPREALELVFQHGFSTREQVSELSGRGVGLDVVRTVVERLGGTVTLDSRVGQGTELVLSIPSQLTLERALVVECGGALYGIPSRQVLDVQARAAVTVHKVAGGEVVRHRDESLPFRSLSTLLDGSDAQEPWVLIVAAGARRWALGCPALVGELELLRQPLDRLLASSQHLGASATLDDGRLVLLLSLPGLVRLTGAVPMVRVAQRAPQKKRARILVVDDSEVIRDLVAQVLRGAGFEVQTAPDGGAALALIETAPPDAVVADVEMPVMDGFELLRRVRQRWADLPVIMLTTRASAEDRRHAVALGANAHLVKSGFQEATLLSTVRRFVEHTA
jgi:chemotaxis protein histidine kinase CheA